MKGNRPKFILAAIVFIIAAFACYVGFVNIGLPFGYYGEFNRVRAKLDKIPNLQIRGTRCNYDTRLEDFTFDVTANDQYDFSLYFHEPPSPSWQLFDAADGLLVRVRKPGDEQTWESAHHWWWFGLGPGSDLEIELGYEMRNLHDAFTHFDDIMKILETTPVGTLDEQWAQPTGWQKMAHLTISVPYSACKPL